jgi:hypothetical protein
MVRCGRSLLLIMSLLSACVDLTRPRSLDDVTNPDGGGGKGGQGGKGGGTGGTAGDGGAGGQTDGGDLDSDAPIGGAAPDADPPEAGPPIDVPLLEVGMRCSEAGQCGSGFCADGFCCALACTGVCQTCALPGSEGTCSAAPEGQDPREECAQEPMAGCGLNGACDGKNACARYAAGTECAPGRCTAAIEYAASLCDGNGACVAGSSRSCSPGMCTGSSCASKCVAQTDCQNGFFCDVGKCVVRRNNGAACTLAVQCASNQCVDGFCCNTTCTQTCSACNVSGKAGTCSPIPSGQDPQTECPVEAPTTCGRAGGCNGAGACRLHAAGVSCQAQSCSGSTLTGARSCNGLGVCQSTVISSCAPYMCSGAACATTCTNSGQCQPGNYCSSGACVAFGPAPVFHWKFDEAGGTTALDASGNGNVGTYFGSSGTPTASANLAPLKGANAFSRAFVASNRQAVRLVPAPAILQPLNNYTISVWFRTTALDLGHTTGSPPGPNASDLVTQNDNWFIRVRSSDVAFTRRASGTYFSCFATGISHLDGAWHHVAGVLSPAGMKIYFDGIERCTNTHGESNLYDRGPDFFVGRHPTSPDWDFDGNVDDVRFYNRPLPPDEIAAIAAGF